MRGTAFEVTDEELAAADDYESRDAYLRIPVTLASGAPTWLYLDSTMTNVVRPDRTEAADYYFKYIDQVGEGDICQILEAQGLEMLAMLRNISEEQARHRYAPDKWSVKQVLGHVNDTERVFVYRALWFARGFDSALPSFDQNIAVPAAASDERAWSSHVEEFRAVRAATTSFFQNVPAEAWARRGTASGNPFSVRALAYVTAGHATHHLSVIRERYLDR